MMAAVGPWANRIIGAGEEAPDQLLANPMNWRIHPRGQQEALERVLDDIGIIQDVIVNQQTGHLIDGHLRVELAMRRGQPTVPVTYVDLTPDEEARALAAFDTIGGMAAADDAKIAELLNDIRATGHGDLAGILAEALDLGGDADGGPGSEDRLLSLLGDVTLPPRHAAAAGETWALGPHRLIVADPVAQVDLWLGPLVEFRARHASASVVVCPYPGPLAFMAAQARTTPALFLQPDPELAGHLLDRAEEVLGGDAIERLAAPLVAPDPDDLEPPPPAPRRRRTPQAPKEQVR